MTFRSPRMAGGRFASAPGNGRFASAPGNGRFASAPGSRDFGRGHGWTWAAAIGVSLAVVAGIVFWLSFTAGKTHEERLAMVPRVEVAVHDTVPAPVVAEAEAPHPTRPTTDAAAPRPPGVAVTASQGAAPLNPPDQHVVMVQAPAEGLVEDTPDGPLPRIASDGRTPWQIYARPFVQEDARPRIAIVMADMGLSVSGTGKALQSLPGVVTLAFSPLAEQLGNWVEESRAQGHEVLLDVGMEPTDYPRSDPGPHSLLVALGPDRNEQRLAWNLSRVTGYVGITSLTGSRLTEQAEMMQPLVKVLKDRGLILLDARASSRSVAAAEATKISLPRALSDSLIDRVPTGPAIDGELAALEDIARQSGVAVGIATPYPISLSRLQAWIPTLEKKGLVLAPLTSVLNKQRDR